ncbi:MAG: thioredoxin family protein [Candidatus Nealsonbacteria bacterium]|nr:thioredoxin family protein [Candidatus Nealsonbacteria bacterium]
MNAKNIFAAIIIAGLIIAGAVIFSNYQQCPEADQGPKISLKEAGERVVNFINDNILRGQATASLVQALEEKDFYKIKFEVEGQEVEWFLAKDGKLLFPEVIDLTEIQELAKETERTIGDFSVSSDEICLEDGKPIVYFFGSETCPYCVWQHPVVKGVMAKFEGYISFHDNMDLNADMEIFQRYSSGGVPTMVLGCKYYRVGSGQSAGEEQEVANLTELVCDLTNNQPVGVCQ